MRQLKYALYDMVLSNQKQRVFLRPAQDAETQCQVDIPYQSPLIIVLFVERCR